jgi:serine/threonine protein kinase
MEFVPARSLRDIVLQDGPLTPQQAAKAGLQLLAALRAAHALGILHRDVKPGNVLIDHDGRAVLADFGIARTQDSPTLTTTGILVGSPAYIAPERARGERGGPESDLWSLGATLYAVVEGRPPYDRGGALATLTAVVTENPDPSRRCGPLRPVISGLLCRDQAARLGPAEAERMLRRIAETNDAPHTAPLPLTAEDDAGSGGAGADRATPGDRLRQAEQTRAFRPAAAELVAAPAVPAEPSSLRTTAGEDATPTPPTGCPSLSQSHRMDLTPNPSPHPRPRTSPRTPSFRAPRTGRRNCRARPPTPGPNCQARQRPPADAARSSGSARRPPPCTGPRQTTSGPRAFTTER